MRIVIDLQGAQNDSRFRGIGRYTLALTKGILQNNVDHEILLVLNGVFAETIEPICAVFEGLIRRENIRVWSSLETVCHCNKKNDWRRRAAEMLREAFLLSLNPDLVLITSMFEGAGDDVITSIGRFTEDIPTAVINYDLIPLLYRKDYLGNSALERWYEEKLDYVRKAAFSLSISESSRQESITHLRLPIETVFNVSTAADEKFRKKLVPPEFREAICSRWGISREFVMYSGASDPRKNHIRLISSYARLPERVRKSHQLVLVGGMPKDHICAFRAHAQTIGLADDELVVTGYIDDDELVHLYNLCRCFIFPTWHEGFGLPALEAMACGAAVIGSNVSSIPEVIGNAAALFDPLDESSISEKLHQVLTDEHFREDLIERSTEQLKMFSWHLTANRAIGAFDRFSKHQNQATAGSKGEQCGLTHTVIVERLIESIARLNIRPKNKSSMMELARCINDSFASEVSERNVFLQLQKLLRLNSIQRIHLLIRGFFRRCSSFLQQ